MAGGGRKRSNSKTTTPMATKRQPTAAKRMAVYESDGDSDSSGSDAVRGPIPLQSLERGAVRDFVAEFERAHAQGSTPLKKATKRARAELEQLAADRHKREFREARAEKVVWRKFDRANRAFEQYYTRALQLTPDAWRSMLAAMRTPVPVHVRVNDHYKSLREIVTGTLELDFNLQGVVVALASGDDEDTAVEFAPVTWGATDKEDKRVWKLSIDGKSFRKADKLRELREYFQTQAQLGTLQRLDPVTSVLPEFLGVQPGDRVLDLCGGGEQRAPAIAELLDEAAAPGALVVNERDAATAARAVQTLSRSLALSREVIVTAHKPIEFPSASDGDGTFERVLCTAPCSGDGLARSNPEKWRTWTPETGLKNHASQVTLIAKAMSLVRVGGGLLYSTRSLNPIENEAVVADLLRTGDGAFELVDLADVCPNLVRSSGLTTWDVLNEHMKEVGPWETISPEERKLLRASMWPPTESEQEGTIHLERCVRLLPHQNDTNAAFIALIRKVREPTQTTPGPAAHPPKQQQQQLSNKQKRRQQGSKAVKKVLGGLTTIDANGVQEIQSFYGIDARALTQAHVMERSGFAKDKVVHIVSAAVSELLQQTYQSRLSVHRAGVEAFKRIASSGSFELTDDGARTLLPVLRRRILQLPMDEFAKLLATKEMWLKNASESSRAVLDETPEGSLVVVLDDMEPVQTADQDVVLVGAKRHNSYSLLSPPAAIARVKTLMKELEAGGEGDDGYDSFEYEDDE